MTAMDQSLDDIFTPQPPAVHGGNGQSGEGPFDCEAERVNGEPLIVRVSDVNPEKVEWLWPGRIAIGKVTLWAGDPGLGKSMATLDIAARVSKGSAWPDSSSTPQEPGGVVLLSAEDDVADTIRPRLDAAEADVSRIIALQAVKQRDACTGEVSTVPFCLTHDLPALETAIGQVESCRLVIIDPVTAYLGRVDSHKNAELRAILGPLADLAARQRVAIVCVSHLNKAAGSSATYRVMGSLAFVAAARAAWCTIADKNDPARRLVLPIKNNLAKDTSGMAYSIRDANGTGVVAWEPEPISGTSVDEALAPAGDEERTDRDDAADWLRDMLADGPVKSKEVFAQARQNGIAEKTLRRAYRDMGGKPHKSGMGGGWSMGLPSEDAHGVPKVPTSQTWASSGGGGHLRQPSDSLPEVETTPAQLPAPATPGEGGPDSPKARVVRLDELAGDLQPYTQPGDTGSIGHREHLARIRRTAAEKESP